MIRTVLGSVGVVGIVKFLSCEMSDAVCCRWSCCGCRGSDFRVTYSADDLQYNSHSSMFSLLHGVDHDLSSLQG